MGGEMEDVKKRLETIENSINELKKEDLFIAKKMCQGLCTTSYNMGLYSFTGEKSKSYANVWKKKLDDVHKKIENSTTPEQATEMVSKFYEELSSYVRASKVDTADKAMEIAHSFIKKYSPVALPLKAERQDDVWMVDIDVGALATKIAKVKVDARTGDILSYEIPEKK